MIKSLVASFYSLSSALLELVCRLAARSLGLCLRLCDQLRLGHVRKTFRPLHISPEFFFAVVGHLTALYS